MSSVQSRAAGPSRVYTPGWRIVANCKATASLLTGAGDTLSRCDPTPFRLAPL